MRLRTPINSLAGDLTLNAPAMGAGGDTGLFTALRYGARIVGSPAACTDAGFTASTTTVVAPNSAMTVSSTVNNFELLAGSAVPGAEKTVCFQLVLPSPAADALQGKSAQPIWNFTGESK